MWRIDGTWYKTPRFAVAKLLGEDVGHDGMQKTVYVYASDHVILKIRQRIK